MTRKTNYPLGRQHHEINAHSEQPQLALGDTVDHTISAQYLEQFTANGGASALDSAVSFADADHTAGQVISSVRSAVLHDTDNGFDKTSPLDVINPTHVTQTTSGADAPATTTLSDAGTQQSTVVGADQTTEIASPFSGTVSFAGSTGTLKIDNSASFAGTISGQLAIGDVIDLADITAGANAKVAYSGNNSPGTLTVSDGTHTASIALDGNYSLANFTVSSDGHGGTLVVDPPLSSADGSAGAPAATPQLSTLLNGYAVRPTWNVAGVDYAVGYASGTALKDPSTISMAGVSVDNVNHIVNINGSNVTLSGYDFSLNGGWGVSVNSGSNDTIQNSKFVVGSNGNTPIYVSSNASNATIQNNLIDGAGTSTQILVAADGAGTTTIQYNQIQNAFGQNLVMSSDVGGENWIVQYNVIENAGLGYNAGAHGDWIQTYNLPGCNTNSFAVNYNTFVQNVPIAQGRTQGISAFSANSGSNAGGVQTESFNNNTIIANNGSYVNFGIILDTTRLIGTGTIQNNYFDTTNIGSSNGGGGYYDFVGAYNGTSGGPYNGTVTQSNNANMVSGTYLGGQSGTPPTWTGGTGATGGTTAPAAPTIASFSPDTGVVGDGITGANQLDLKGSAAANSTVTVYDGSTKLGTTTATSTGSWDYITAVLTDAKHVLTATATNSSGQTSAASSALTVTVDTHVPAAPTIVSDTVNSANQVVMSGNAEANSTIKVYEGTTQVGTAVTNSTGVWNLTTSALSTGSHTLTATATDAAGNTSAASSVVDPIVGTTPTPPVAPTISSFSVDSGVVGDHITNDNTPTLTGTAVANSTVNVFDGTTQIGTTTANSSGSWTITTPVLADGTHSLTATDTDASGLTSAASGALSVSIDTHVPSAPTIATYSQAGSAIGSTTTLNDVVLKGTAEANSTIDVFDGGHQIGTATTNGTGAWSYDTGALANGAHSFTATAIDVAGTSSVASAADAVSVNASVSASVGHIDFTNLSKSWSHVATVTGTTDAYSQVNVYDGTTTIGTVKAAADGTWSFTTPYLTNTVHTFTAQEVDSTGNAIATTSGQAILGSTHSDTLTSTAGNDILVGNGGADTFVFAPNFGNDVIKDFVAGGGGHDTIQFSHTEFDSFASVLSHAAQVGHDVVISTGTDTLTLKNTKMGALTSQDFHFA